MTTKEFNRAFNRGYAEGVKAGRNLTKLELEDDFNNSCIRKSTINDKEMIQNLMWLCFGDKNNLEPFENLNNRYFLYFKNDMLIAMTGLTSNSEYGHLEIDWTCTHPDFRHNGYMQELFAEMLSDVKEDIYCSCWRLPNNYYTNLHTLMSLFGFEEVVQSRTHWKVPHNCFRDYEGGCSYCTGINCECYEDLFLRKRKIQ